MKPIDLRAIILFIGFFFPVSLKAVLFNGIYYNVHNADMTASVSGYDHYYNIVNNHVDLVIADEIVYENKVYKVTSIEEMKKQTRWEKGNRFPITYYTGPFMYTFGNGYNGGDNRINSLVIGNNITSIPEYAFYLCTGLTSITIGNSVTTIGEHAFSGCKSLTSVTIPNSVTSIGAGAFGGCSGLTSVTIGNSVTSIGNRAFSNCTGLTSISIPNSVNTINDNTFSGCSSLNSLTIGAGVVSIGSNAFFNCTSLKSLVIPRNVASINQDSFLDCIGLESIKVEPGNSIFDSRENCNAIIETSTNVLKLGCMNTVIPNTVSEIGSYAFRGYVLPSLYVTDNINKIGDGNSAVKVIDLSYCLDANKVSSYIKISSLDYRNLNSLFEVDGLVYVPVSPSDRTCAIIDNKKFKSTGRYDIGTVTFNGITFSVTKIGDYAFYKNNIKELKLDFNGSIGESAFAECDSLETVETNGNISFNPSDKRGATHKGAFYGCDGLVSVKIGYGLTSIWGFADCKNLKQIELSNSVKKIEGDAFLRCSSLQSVKMGSGVSYVGMAAFEDCTSLKDIQLCNVRVIEKYAYSNCTALSNIVIPPSLTEINACAFENCENLRNVIIESGSKLFFKETYYSTGDWFKNCPIESVYIGRDVGGDFSPFSGGTIKKLRIAGNISFNSGGGAFSGCKNLKTVKIEDGATKIGPYDFRSCSSLESVSVGSGIISIGKEAFSGCVGLTSLICEAVTPPGCSSNALTDINKWNCKLYVPGNSITQYQVANQWKEFFFIDTIDNFLTNVQSIHTQPVSVHASNGLITISNVKEGQYIAIYLIDGTHIASATAVDGTAQVVTNVKKGNVLIVRICEKAHKVMMQ